MKRGLTLGKFAPLHKGHQYLIETAMKVVDELTIMIYDDPSVSGAPPLPVRSKWLRELYPKAKVIEAWGGPSENGYTREIMQKHEQYIAKALNGEKITHFFASEPYAAHICKALGAKGAVIDSERVNIPISATMVRSDPHKYKEFLEPRVYRDLITNVVFMGGPSTGKTTLAQTLAKKHKTEWMPEYGREYWTEHQQDRRLDLNQLLEIATGHIKQEDELLAKSNKYLFTDTNAITTYLFSMDYHGAADPKLYELARQCSSRYDLFFLCDTDIPYDDTWDRSGESNRQEMQRRTIAFLQEHKIPYFTLHGTLEERIQQADSVLSRFKKYQNIGDFALGCQSRLLNQKV